MQDSVKIRKALSKDAKKVENLVSSVHLSRIKTTEEGFLMKNLGIEGYRLATKNTKYFYVAEIRNEIVAFLLAYSKESLKPTSEAKAYMLKNYRNEDFIYVFQVAVHPDYRKKGIGKSLYRALFDGTIGLKKIVFTSSDPYNKTSENFHLRIGFRKISKIKWKNGESGFVYEMK